MLLLLLLPLLLDLVVNVVVDVDVDVVGGVAEAVDKCGQQLKLFVIAVVVVMMFVVDV